MKKMKKEYVSLVWNVPLGLLSSLNTTQYLEETTEKADKAAQTSMPKVSQWSTIHHLTHTVGSNGSNDAWEPSKLQ